MAVSGLTVTKLRESVVDFSVAYMRSSSDMILKKKTVEDIDYLQFMLPFQFLVWVMVLVCLLVVTVATFTLNYYSPYGHKDDEGRGTSPEFNLFNSLWFSLACMLQQGGDNTPKSTSGRIWHLISGRHNEPRRNIIKPVSTRARIAVPWVSGRI